MNKAIIIPARYQSSRLPGKPLVNILGKTLLQRTWEQCVKAVDAHDVYVATDDQRILDHCAELGMQVLWTSANCLTGTDRVAEAASQLDGIDYVINVQGDEPLMEPGDIRTIWNLANEYPDVVINGFCPIDGQADYCSHSVPKVVFDQNHRLLYMSRSPIPGNKAGSFIHAFRQVCIYGFPVRALKQFSGLNGKGFFERIEDIEILRFIEAGIPVQMIELSGKSIPVDHPEDILKVETALNFIDNAE